MNLYEQKTRGQEKPINFTLDDHFDGFFAQF